MTGNEYLLPQNRYLTPSPQLAAPEQGASPFLNLPDPKDDIAYVEGLTDKFFDLKGKVESYAMSMEKQYGIDVTEPDASQPGGGLPFKTYHKLATDLLSTATDLKERSGERKAQLPYLMNGSIRQTPGYNPQSQERTPFTEQFYSTKLLPGVEQANSILKTQVYTQSDYDRFKTQVLDPTLTELTREMSREDITPSEREYLKYNIEALKQQPRSSPYAMFQGMYNNGRKTTVEEDILRDTTNLAQARWPKGTYTVETDQKTGDAILVNKKREGEQSGEHVYETTDRQGNTYQKRIPRIIDRWVKRSDGTYLEFKQQDGISIPPEKVSDKRGDAVTSSIISSNAKYGDVRKMYEAAREKGYTDKTGSVINEKLLGNEKEFGTPDPATLGAGIQTEKQRILSQLAAVPDPGWLKTNNSFIDFRLPDGSKARFYRNRIGGGWYLDGGEGENLDEGKIVEFLASKKYFDRFLNQDGATVQKTSEELKAEELIKKYLNK